jgi:hypothetical protein
MHSRLLPCVCLAALLGCGRAAAPPVAVADAEYYPLQLGTTWVYRGGDAPRKIRVARHRLVAGTPCALVETLRGQEVVGTEDVYATAEGIYALTSNGRKLSRPLLILKLPPMPGTTWDEQFKLGKHTEQATYLVGKEEDVEVPLGRYRAITLHGEIQENGVRRMAFVYWFARDVGMVKQVVKLPEQTLTYELERLER